MGGVLRWCKKRLCKINRAPLPSVDLDGTFNSVRQRGGCDEDDDRAPTPPRDVVLKLIKGSGKTRQFETAECPMAKRLKLCKDTVATTSGDTLVEICDWSGPRDVAIKHYDLTDSIMEITYSQLAEAQLCVEQILKDTKRTQFIGIAYDAPSYCLPGLMLGIMSSNHAFVCLPQPTTEAQRMCETLNISQIFCSKDVQELETTQSFKIHGAEMCLVQAKELYKLPMDAQKSVVSDESWGKFAYAVATSGSTGEPKIVRVTHRSIVPNIRDLKRITAATGNDTIAQMTPVTFDPSIVEIFLSLSCKGTLLTVSQGLKNDARLLLETLVKSQVSILQSTPSVLLHRWSSEELRNTILGTNSNLRVLLLGGETLPSTEILSRIKAPGNATRIFDIYGITEVSCWATVREIESHDSDRSIGESLSETILEVRDETGKIVEEGEGVLHIGSSSRICVIDDEDIDSSSKPIFRDTGDIVEIDRKGALTLKGRRGRMVKRYGTRLHLSELETHVSKLAFVENCHALFVEKNQSLHLYFTIFNKHPEDDEKLSYEKDVSSHAMQLPSLHHPDEVRLLSRFELTSHGKICSKYLKKYSARLSGDSRTEKTVKGSPVEVFTELWKRSLPSSGDSGFLDSGGSSVMALRIASELSDRVGFDFPELIGQLLTNKNFHACQEYVERQSSNRSSAAAAENDAGELTDESIEPNIADRSAREEEKQSAQSSNGPTAWQKCRGRSTFYSSTEVKNEKVWDGVSKIFLDRLYRLGKCVDASPTVFGYPGGESYVTVGSHSGEICTAELSKKNSPRHWEIRLPDRIEASVLVLDDFRGVVGSYDGYVYCLHLKTGKIFWKFKTDEAVKCTAVLCSRGRNVFFGSYDHYAYCVGLENGSEVWKVKVGNGSICATPCVHAELDAVFFALLDGTCASLKQKSGEINWKHKLDYPVFSAPVVLNIGVAVFCDVTGKLSCFSASTGEKTWTVETNGAIFSHLVIHTDQATKLQSLVFASKNRYIYRLECRCREEKPIFRLKEDLGVPIFSTPWTNGRVIVVVGVDGELKLLDFMTGKELSRFKLGGDVFSSPVIHDDLIVVGCRDNNLYVLSVSES